MHVFTDSEELIVATDEADARAVMNDLAGGEVWGSEVEVEQLPDDKRLTLLDESEDGPFETTLTCGQWAASKGRGFLAGPVV